MLVKGLAFPNGVALSRDSSFILVAESTTLKILKIALSGGNNIETFAEVPRSPDNIKRNAKGEFWVALNSGRGRINGLEKGTEVEATVPWTTDPVAIKFDAEGNVVEVLDGRYGQQLNSVSEVEEHDGSLWIGSAVQPYIAVIKP